MTPSKTVLGKYSFERSRLKEVGDLEHLLWDRLAMPGGKVIQRDDLMPLVRQEAHHVRSDITGATANQDFHRDLQGCRESGR